MNSPYKMGDRATSDVVVRIRTEDGRDDRFYCHSRVLIDNSKYFADRLSDDWPTCQILDSRYCVEVFCDELDFDHHINTLRILYESMEIAFSEAFHGVRNALGILRAATHLECRDVARMCADYLEAVPWEEAEEEEILKTVPSLGSFSEVVLARMQPVDPASVHNMFVSTIRFAMSSPPPSMQDAKISAQEQFEYMLTEDDDAPLLMVEDDMIKRELMECAKDLFLRFENLVESISETLPEVDLHVVMEHYLSDLSWACQILGKFEAMKDFIRGWVGVSDDVVEAVERLHSDSLETELKLIEVVAKVLEAIGYGHVILPAPERLLALKVWLPFVRKIKVQVEYLDHEQDSSPAVKLVDVEVWQGLEASIIAIVLALPSSDQAEVLAEWLKSGEPEIRYPDLTEAFEMWCYRSKVARRRLGSLAGMNSLTK
ncbi:BTB/POZ domain-containing protein [Acorus gramineus]|uniref:BTB/POZ domain-containing protein n=1 Tax=Acorus gramineus TaxID=55184 RepID=A0AAV9BEF7_ACOGR|nr:BTB/POZ domain-containing protein [Acorus gramineus]